MFSKQLETNPENVGPIEHPISPARASKANIAVPPYRIEAAALLKVPGHIMPTDNPQIAQNTRLITGYGAMDIAIYDIMHRQPLKSMN